MNSFSRVLTALTLTTSLLASTIAVAAQTTTTTQAPAAQTEKPAKTTPSQTPDPKKEQAKPQTTSTKAAKPLSTNEDPAMIGKRNINGGIISKMSGSNKEKVADGSRDPLQKIVERLLGEDLVEDVRQPTVRLDERIERLLGGKPSTRLGRRDVRGWVHRPPNQHRPLSGGS